MWMINLSRSLLIIGVLIKKSLKVSTANWKIIFNQGTVYFLAHYCPVAFSAK
jgi:hypothetical protein